MALNLRPGSDDHDEPILDINTTPLIDVMLVLLVMLIITIPIQLHAVNLNLPVTQAPPPEKLPEVIRLDIDADSRLWWNGQPVADRAELEQRLGALAALADPPELHIRPHRQARYRVFTEVMVSANRLGLTRLGVVGHEQFVEP